tara:strand:+ start:2612 stop:3490 length:879 start_codon:yes stop_codon:yes gene_type:complete
VIPAKNLKYQSIKHLLFKRSEHSHKGSNGHALVIGGEHGFGGAALMAAEACARSGAGLVSVATRPSHINAFLARRPEIMVQGLEKADDLGPLLDKATVVIIGPGLGQSAWSRACLDKVLQAQSEHQVPMILDADALNLISLNSLPLPDSGLFIMTPHPGEAARLLERKLPDLQDNREQACLDIQAKFGGVCILKGAGTLIAFKQGGQAQQSDRVQLERCSHGNPGMGTGGMGDILSGVLGGLLAQNFSLSDSARLGVCIHSLSADLAASDTGERGLLATDLLTYIHKLVNAG